MKGEGSLSSTAFPPPGADPVGSPPAQEAEPQQPPGGWLTASDARPQLFGQQQRAHHPSGRRVPGAPAAQTGPRRGPGREGRSQAGAWPHTHAGQARQRLLVQGGGQDVLAIRRELHKGHGGVVVICVEHRCGCRGALAAGGLPHHRPVRSPPRVRTLPPPTTRASMRAAPPRDPRTGALQEQRPWGQTASGGRAFRRPPATSPQGTEKASGWPSRTGLAHTQLPCGHSHQDSAGLKVLLKVTVGQRRFPLETTWLCHAHSPTPDWGGSAPGGPREAGRSCWLGRASLGGTWPGDRAAPACGGAPSAPW